ncbi:MAG TPA: hypothetical protein VFP12_03275 [Allosphingosinicella sp.]|nr:hypothetical protein [Allosphingosinicella sp.]
MRKPFNILSSIAVAAVLLSANPASAQSVNPAYNTTLYSDASHTTQVGSIIWTGCDHNNFPTYRLFGTYSVYGVDEPAGYCVDGDMQPL